MASSSFPVAVQSSFTVPDGITVLAFDVAGGAGVADQSTDIGAPAAQAGGRGAHLTGYMPVTPGEVLWIVVGQAGQVYPSAATNGTAVAVGGAGGGGAATMIGRGAVSAANAVVVAAGGGGGGETGAGGDGGGIGAAAAGTNGGKGGGQDSTYTADVGEGAAKAGAAGGGGGAVGGRAGTITGTGSSDSRGGGGGGSSKYPTGTKITKGSVGAAGAASVSWGITHLAPTLLAPAAGAVVPAGRPLTLSWQANPVSPGDVQTQAAVTYHSVNGDFTVPVVGAAGQYVLAAVDVPAGPMSWAVTTTGQGGSPSPSSAGTFTAAVPPADPVITAPATGAAQTSGTATLTWTAGDQTAWRVRKTNADASVVYDDTGMTVDATTRSRLLTFTTNGRTEYPRLSVLGSSGAVSNEVVVALPVQWTRPAVPTLTVTPDRANGSFIVALTTPTQAGRPAVTGVSFEAVEVDGTRTAIVAGVEADGVRRWRLPAGDVDYTLVATVTSAAGATASTTDTGATHGFGAGPFGSLPFGS